MYRSEFEASCQAFIHSRLILKALAKKRHSTGESIRSSQCTVELITIPTWLMMLQLVDKEHEWILVAVVKLALERISLNKPSRFTDQDKTTSSGSKIKCEWIKTNSGWLCDSSTQLPISYWLKQLMWVKSEQKRKKGKKVFQFWFCHSLCTSEHIYDADSRREKINYPLVFIIP